MHDFLLEKLNESYDKETIEKITFGLKCKKKTTFRVNHIKSTMLEVGSELSKNSIIYDRYKYFDDTFIVASNYKTSLENLSIYRDGKIYIQSISSMIPVYVLKPMQGENILDMCAAPGSKTTLIQSMVLNKTNLTAVELHKDRFERLKYNLNLQGANAFAMNISALDLDDNFKFDKILLDAPCSGSGILDINDERYEKYFTSALIEKCVKTQKRLMDKASKLLKKGGLMVYSTCSLLREENEDMISFADSKGFKASKIDCDYKEDNIMCTDNYIKVLPDDIYEGFFVMSFIKN